MKTLQDSEVCWPTLHTNAQGSLQIDEKKRLPGPKTLREFLETDV